MLRAEAVADGALTEAGRHSPLASIPVSAGGRVCAWPRRSRMRSPPVRPAQPGPRAIPGSRPSSPRAAGRAPARPGRRGRARWAAVVGHDPPADGGPRDVPRGGARVPVRGAAPAPRRAPHVGPPRPGRRVVDRGGGGRGGRVDGQLHRDLPGRARAPGLADPLPPHLPDHDGGARGHAPVRRGRRRRGGGHGVVAAPLGDGAPRGGAADDRLPGAAVRGVHGGAGGVRGGPLHGRVPRLAPVRDHDRPGDRGRGGVVVCRVAFVPADLEQRLARVERAPGNRRAGAPGASGSRAGRRRLARPAGRASPSRSCATRTWR